MAELQGYPAPVFFSEDGCNVIRPRTFSDLQSVYGPNMTTIMSGAIIYEWTQEPNDYGIIQYPDTAIQDGVVVPVGVPSPMQPEFDNLKSAWAEASPSSISAVNYNPTISVMVCPAATEGIWTIDGNAELPGTPGKLTAPKASSYSFTGTLPAVTFISKGTTIVFSGTSTGVVGSQNTGDASASPSSVGTFQLTGFGVNG